MADIAPSRRDQLGPASGGSADPTSGDLAHRRPDDHADDSGTDTDDEGRLIQQATATAKMREPEKPRAHQAAGPVSASAPSRPPPPAAAAPLGPPQPARVPRPHGPAKGKAAPKRPAGAITLRTLLDAGFLVSGCKVLYVEYKGLITWADLTEEGSIVCDGSTFESPSAFSIFVKRKLNPERKADDGWKAVKYAGKLLEHFKEQYLRQQLAASGLGGGRGVTPSASLGPSAGGAAGTGPGPSPHSSVHQSPVRGADGWGGDANGAEEDGPPSKRQRTDGDGEGGAGSRPGLKIKLKLKDGPGGGGGGGGGGGAPGGPGARPPVPAAGRRPGATAPAPTGPLRPVPAPAVAPVACTPYTGQPGTFARGAQPFRLEVSDMAVIVMDFHAHCSSAEVGGLLGGAYDPDSRTLTVARAFPVLEAPQGPATTWGPWSGGAARGGGGGGCNGGSSRPAVQVAFDTTDLARVREVIRNWGLQCVGSYRTHPAYSATPNALDVTFAAREQDRARTPDGEEPYVCAVLSPYDPDIAEPPSSDITWFHVEYDRSKPLPPPPAGAAAAAAAAAVPPPGLRPMSLSLDTAEVPTAHMDIMNLVATQFQHTARTYAMRPSRAPMALPWRPATPSSGARHYLGGAPAGTLPHAPHAASSGAHRLPVTCLDKLVASVVSRLPDMFEGDLRIQYGNMVRDMVRHEFSLAERMGGGGQSRASYRGSEDGLADGGYGFGGGGSLALERSRRATKPNGALAAARFDSDEEETEEDDDEVRLDDDDEAAAEDDDEM